jgi:hypothetical protein
MYVNTSVAVGGTSLKVTLRDNGVDTALTCTILAGNTTCNLTGQSVATTAGHLYNFDLFGTGATGTFTTNISLKY